MKPLSTHSTIAWTLVHSAVVSRFVTVNGLRIHCRETGRPGVEPLLLMIHGWTGSAEDWAPLLGVLPDRVRAIAIDLPGCGLSDKPDAAYDMPWFLDFLHGLCAVLGAPRVVLAGHSMGGQIAIHFATRYPDMVEKLILIDPYGLKGEEGGLRALAHLGPVVNLGFMLNTRFFIEWAMRANVLYHSPPESLRTAVDSTAVSILGRNGARAIARITRRVIGRAYVDALLPGIFQETLVLWGDHDRILPPHWGQAFASRLPRVSLRIVADAGHMPMFERPAVVAEMIAQFVSGYPM
jgi:pimeloyl-ACP methyl ester carboxylesterase